MIDAVLLDGENRSTLAVTRSLGRRGLKVGVVGPLGCISHASRYCSQVIVQSKEQSRHIVELKQLLLESQPSLFLPMSDQSIGLVSTDPEVYKKSPFPDLQAMRIVQEKEKLLELCKNLNVLSPKTKLVSSDGDIMDWNQFPSVLKPAHASDVGKVYKPMVKYFNNFPDLQNHIRTNREDAPWLLQEQISGPGIGVFILAKDGQVITTFGHQRILDKPPSGGVSVLSKSISRSEAPVAEASRLISALRWTGVAMVEFKRCNIRNQPFLMEINPRFWGSLQLSISAGVDFPWLLYLLNKGELDSYEGVKALEMARNYKVGKRLRWDLGTLDHLFIRLKEEGISVINRLILKNELHLSLSADTKHETISYHDLAPFWVELKNYLGIGKR